MQSTSPLWVGVPLGALLAYATSEGWKAYFTDTRRYKLLAFNIASLAAATFVITPVLFSMASAPIDEIDLAALLPPVWLLAWAGVLAVTTFAPLIQLAAVKSAPAPTTPTVPTETPTSAAARSTSTSATAAPHGANPVGTAKALDDSPNPAEQVSTPSVQPQPDKLTKEQRRALIAEWQLQRTEQVMESFGVGKRTADGDLAWVRSNTMHTNGVAK